MKNQRLEVGHDLCPDRGCDTRSEHERDRAPSAVYWNPAPSERDAAERENRTPWHGAASVLIRRHRKLEPQALFWTLVLGFGTGRSRSLLAALRRTYEGDGHLARLLEL